jgi:hypothetical protein
MNLLLDAWENLLANMPSDPSLLADTEKKTDLLKDTPFLVKFAGGHCTH